MTLHDLLDVVFRWAHLIAGIMWIGNSMLFNWMDRNLVKSASDGALSQGKIFMVHSGAFYDVEKKLLAPGELPDQLHWFKWQNGITWLTGISLLVVVYYMNGAAFLVDPSVRDLAPSVAVTLSISALFGGWLVYDGLWRTVGERRPVLAHSISLALLFGAAYGFTQMFSGRAAYIQTGVLMGTVMTGNVWFVILPSQRELIAATRDGRPQDPALSLRAKARSIHNNYITFPLLFIMISNHFPTTASRLNWAILFAVMVGGAGVRHFMNVRYAGKVWLGPALGSAALALGGLFVLSTLGQPAAVAAAPGRQVSFARVREIVDTRCMSCHSSRATDPLAGATGTVKFDTPEQLARYAPRIKERVVVLRTMPFNNQTHITDEERAELGAWVEAGAPVR